MLLSLVTRQANPGVQSMLFSVFMYTVAIYFGVNLVRAIYKLYKLKR